MLPVIAGSKQTQFSQNTIIATVYFESSKVSVCICDYKKSFSIDVLLIGEETNLVICLITKLETSQELR